MVLVLKNKKRLLTIITVLFAKLYCGIRLWRPANRNIPPFFTRFSLKIHLLTSYKEGGAERPAGSAPKEAPMNGPEPEGPQLTFGGHLEVVRRIELGIRN